jgi:hypothetical protein
MTSSAAPGMRLTTSNAVDSTSSHPLRRSARAGTPAWPAMASLNRCSAGTRPSSCTAVRYRPPTASVSASSRNDFP